MMNKNILFVTHKPTQCGVYEFGKNVYNVIEQSICSVDTRFQTKIFAHNIIQRI